jgi:hypothetical protein
MFGLCNVMFLQDDYKWLHKTYLYYTMLCYKILCYDSEKWERQGVEQVRM